MYRITWFDKKEYTNDINLVMERPVNWINVNDIEKVQISTWEEHCLECAVPECYNECQRYVCRADKKCKKTCYGIKHRDDLKEIFPTAVQLKFMEWGKIETLRYDRYLSFDKWISCNKSCYYIDKSTRAIANILKPISPTLKPCGAAEYFKNKLFSKYHDSIKLEEFLFQCYSDDEESYNMFFEMLNKGNVCYRTALEIKKGYNQCVIDFDKTQKDYDLIRFYPENNKMAEIVILFSDFVVLKNNVLKTPAKKVKCVAWDLDNTVWDGVLIESDPEQLLLRDGVPELIKELDRRGIIQVVVSKNDYNEVEPVLKRLNIKDYFVYIVANWQRKSQNLLDIAKKLNINIDTFALIDDSFYERGEVKESIPQMRAYDEKIIDSLLSLEEFDVIVTEESKNRRQMYMQEAERLERRTLLHVSDVEFLKDCELKLFIRELNDSNKTRSYELLGRTNQLNLSGIKYTEGEFDSRIADAGEYKIVLDCMDKFGSYGQIGFVIYKVEDNVAYISEYAMSCRVAGKWLEPALFAWLQEKYMLNKISLLGINNKKNQRLIDTLLQYGFVNSSKDNERLQLEINKEDINWPCVVEVVSEIP